MVSLKKQFMTQPLRFEVNDKSLVFKINKDLYGLKQASWQWLDKLQTTRQFGFVKNKCDSSLFVDRKKSRVIYFLGYVDDIIIISSFVSLIQNITTKLHTTFSLKQLGHLDYFLGLEIKYLLNKSIIMTQSKYIWDLLHNTHMVEAHSISSPMVSNCKLSSLGLIYFQTLLYIAQWQVLCNMSLLQDQKSALLWTKFVNLWPNHWILIELC